jgi:hypothetical protein
MREILEQYELIKEVHFIFEDFEPVIKVRIFKIIKGAEASFTWSVNFYCRLGSEATVYIPSAPFGNSVEEVEAKSLKYIERFGQAVSWEKNEDF